MNKIDKARFVAQVREGMRKYGKEYTKIGELLIDSILSNLDSNAVVSKAIDKALAETDFFALNKELIKNVLFESACAGYGILPSVVANKDEITSSLMNKPWTSDGINLSKRLHSNNKIIRQNIVDIVNAGMLNGSGINKIARQIYDGYNSGIGVLDKVDLPKKLKQLETKARFIGDDKEKLNKLIAQIKKQDIDNLKTDSLRAAYNDLLKKLVKATDEIRPDILKKAVDVAVNERTRYFANRIARTEAAQAWFDGFVAENKDNDLVVAYKFMLSTAHKVVDICDMYAQTDMFGLGAGIYPKNELPRIPIHPHCMCYYVQIFIDEVDISKKKARVDEAGREWIANLSDNQRLNILGKIGFDVFAKGGNWKHYADGWTGLFNPVSRIATEFVDNRLLPNYKNAVVPKGKIKNYALDNNHVTGKHKAIVFQSALGYNQSNAEDLIDNIKLNLPYFMRTTKPADVHGERFDVVMLLAGPNGKEATVVTGWILEYGEKNPRLTTVFVDSNRVVRKNEN